MKKHCIFKKAFNNLLGRETVSQAGHYSTDAGWMLQGLKFTTLTDCVWTDLDSKQGSESEKNLTLVPNSASVFVLTDRHRFPSLFTRVRKDAGIMELF